MQQVYARSMLFMQMEIPVRQGLRGVTMTGSCQPLRLNLEFLHLQHLNLIACGLIKMLLECPPTIIGALRSTLRSTRGSRTSSVAFRASTIRAITAFVESGV